MNVGTWRHRHRNAGQLLAAGLASVYVASEVLVVATDRYSMGEGGLSGMAVSAVLPLAGAVMTAAGAAEIAAHVRRAQAHDQDRRIQRIILVVGMARSQLVVMDVVAAAARYGEEAVLLPDEVLAYLQRLEAEGFAGSSVRERGDLAWSLIYNGPQEVGSGLPPSRALSGVP